ncbi:25176_t:CDS:2, partial [Dentiscutata erythropus]
RDRRSFADEVIKNFCEISEKSLRRMPERKVIKSITDYKENEWENRKFETNQSKHSLNPNNDWSPLNIQEAKIPVYFQKQISPIFDIDEIEGWGEPPRNPISWNDSHQGYCKELIEEQKKTTFWAIQNGVWVNVSEETETKVSERISNNIRNNIIKRGEIWDKIKKQTRSYYDFRNEENRKAADFIYEEENDLINFDLSDISDSKNSSDGTNKTHETTEVHLNNLLQEDLIDLRDEKIQNTLNSEYNSDIKKEGPIKIKEQIKEEELIKIEEPIKKVEPIKEELLIDLDFDTSVTDAPSYNSIFPNSKELNDIFSLMPKSSVIENKDLLLFDNEDSDPAKSFSISNSKSSKDFRFTIETKEFGFQVIIVKP